MTKEEFTKIYLENSNKDAAKKLKIAELTLISYAKKLGLSKPRGRKLGSTKIKLEF